MHHLPKSLSRSIVHEASIMFAEELTVAATRGFRESKRGLADLEMAWLVTHLMIERWREALLWSWVVGRVGGASGIWGEAARDELRTVFGVQAGQEQGSIEVKKGERTTLVNAVGITRQVGWEAPKNSQFQFCKCSSSQVIRN